MYLCNASRPLDVPLIKDRLYKTAHGKLLVQASNLFLKTHSTALDWGFIVRPNIHVSSNLKDYIDIAFDIWKRYQYLDKQDSV